MTRWRRRYKRFQKRKNSSSSSSNSNTTSSNGDNINAESSTGTYGSSSSRNAWTWRERPQVLAYLQAYREGVIRVYHKSNNNNRRDHGLDPPNHHLPSHHETPTVAAAVAVVVVDDIIVGTIALPALTVTILCRPYLVLPSTLSAKQRKMVHECCIEADLYHATVSRRKGSSRRSSNSSMMSMQRNTTTSLCTPRQEEECEQKEERHVVVSVYEDGFDSISELHNKRRSCRFAPHQFRPWVCRQQQQQHDETVSLSPDQPATKITTTTTTTTTITPTQSQEEAIARRKIEALIDQPGNCLRDDCDGICDIEHAQTESLANTTPPTFSSEEWLLVDCVEKLHQCIQELHATKPSFLAFDLEAHNPSKYAQLTCLLQLTTEAGKEYVIDTSAPGVWEQVHLLAPFFGDASIVKIGHSIGGLDVQSLHRDFGIFVVNAFDTYEAAKVLHLPAHGLAAVCEYYGLPDCKIYAALKAEYQTCDWTVRPLTTPMLLYGRYDIHYLIQLRRLMVRDLTREAWSSSPINEGYLVANALAETLKQFEDEEDGTNWNDEADCITELDSDCENDESEPEDETIESFKSTKMQQLCSQSSLSDNDDDDDDASFVTSKTSLSLDPATASSESLGKSSSIGSRVVDTYPLSKLDVPVLRMQPELMRVLSYSQERCLRMWKSRVEPHLQNSHFISLIHRARRNEVDWTVAKTHLYNSLVEWRERVAIELECLPPFVTPLEFLVSMALKRPLTESALRKIAFHLPLILEENAKYRQQVISIIHSSCERKAPTEEKISYLFSNLKIASVQWNGKKRGGSFDRNDDAIENRNTGLAFKICAVGALLAASAFVVTNAWRRKR